MENKETPIILICNCSSHEHQIIIEHNKEDNLAYCYIHMTKYNFWKRLKYGLKYIFGYTCKYGHFEEFIFKSEHSKQLKDITELLEK
jgi:hypothetical protein